MCNLTIFILVLKIQSKMRAKRMTYLKMRKDTQVQFKRRELLFITTCFLNSSKPKICNCLPFFLINFFKDIVWIIGFMVMIPFDEIGIDFFRYGFAILFAILNSVHGFHIFYVYIVISDKRKSLLLEKINIRLNALKRLVNRY